jgi:hypothetical protein
MAQSDYFGSDLFNCLIFIIILKLTRSYFLLVPNKQQQGSQPGRMLMWEELAKFGYAEEDVRNGSVNIIEVMTTLFKICEKNKEVGKKKISLLNFRMN